MQIHETENNHDSRRHLEENRKKFSKQCGIVLELLQQGVKLTTRKAILHYGIGDLRRRLKDLKDYHDIKIDEEWELDENGKTTRNKVWFINFKTEAQKKEHVYRKGEKSAADHAGELIKSTKSKFIQPELFQP